MKVAKGLAVLICVFSLLLVVCSCTADSTSPAGEYEFEDVVYIGGMTSSTLSELVDQKAGTRYSIKESSLSITDGNGTTEYEGLTVVKEELTTEFIDKNYGDQDEQLLDLFSKYTMKYRYTFLDKSGKQIDYILFQLDSDLFISQITKSEKLMFSIDKIS